MGAVTLAAVGRGCSTPSSGRQRSPAQLEQVERQRRGPANIQNDLGAHRPRGVRRVPAQDPARGDVHLSPLWEGGGHGAAHAGGLPGVGGTATCLTTRDRREIGPWYAHRSYAQGAPGVHSRPHLLRVSHAREGASGERKRESPAYQQSATSRSLRASRSGGAPAVNAPKESSRK